MTAIHIENICKKYASTLAVNDLSLAISEGELFTLLGVNGAGKTTLIKMLSCLVKPTQGEAYLMGHSITQEAEKVKRCIAVSPQESAVAGGLSVRENLMLMCGAHGYGREEQTKKTEKMLAAMQLNSIAEKKAAKLSGGWQRRLSIAMALISDPQILFLDEPTLGLDVLARSDLWEVIRSLKGKITILLTTHYMEEAEALSDRIGIMKEGRLICVDTAKEIKQRTSTQTLEAAFIAIVKGAQI